MALTVRLTESLQAEASAYGQAVGLSLNSLVVVALTHYLKDMGRPIAAPVVDLVGGGAADIEPGVEPEPEVGKDDLLFFPGSNRRPCKCGSGKPWRNCHGKR